MSMDFIRRMYSVPAKRGARVAYTSAEEAVQGVIVSARGPYLRIRWDDSGRTTTHHPEDCIKYLAAPTSEKTP
jgi:hypothetical protein